MSQISMEVPLGNNITGNPFCEINGLKEKSQSNFRPYFLEKEGKDKEMDEKKIRKKLEKIKWKME